MKDIVFQICQSMLQNSPERSYKRLNPALRSTLSSCIEADLPFRPDTFQRIYNELRGSWWFGDGAGSHVGERFYTLACECNHASAQQSFEAFAQRPGVLWEENISAPERLHVGSRFTWRGYYVTVTSMRAEDLVACTYKDTPSPDGIKVGAMISDYSQRDDKHFVVVSNKRDGKGHVLRVIPQKREEGSSSVAKRFNIPYAEILQFRRSEARRVKAVLDEIAKCDPLKDGPRLSKQISEAHFRHFELEKFKAAYTKRIASLDKESKRALELLEKEKSIKAWRGGVNGAYLAVEANLLRVQGDQVQCSNGNCVNLAAARRLLPIIMARRHEHGAVSLPLDGHTVQRIDAEGVTIGCTFVTWEEVERIAPELS